MKQDGCKLGRWQVLSSMLNNLDPESFLQRVQSENEDIQLLDVRTQTEFECGHLNGAQNLDYLGSSFLDFLEQLPKNGYYLVYCRSGRRSARVCMLLQNAGFANVFNLNGGLKSIKNYESLLSKPTIVEKTKNTKL